MTAMLPSHLQMAAASEPALGSECAATVDAAMARSSAGKSSIGSSSRTAKSRRYGSTATSPRGVATTDNRYRSGRIPRWTKTRGRPIEVLD